MTPIYKRKNKKRLVKKRREKSLRHTKREPRFGFVQELLFLLMVVCTVGSFFVETPWSGILMFGGLVSLFLLALNATLNKKLRRYLESEDKKIELQDEEPGWEAIQLMNGLKHKNHYKDLPQEVKEKSIFGKFE